MPGRRWRRRLGEHTRLSDSVQLGRRAGRRCRPGERPRQAAGGSTGPQALRLAESAHGGQAEGGGAGLVSAHIREEGRRCSQGSTLRSRRGRDRFAIASRQAGANRGREGTAFKMEGGKHTR
jgi:hypothetical protein